MASTKKGADQSSVTGVQSTFDFITNGVICNTPCSRCGKPIMTVRGGNHIVSEYIDAEGRCWTCAGSNRNK